MSNQNYLSKELTACWHTEGLVFYLDGKAAKKEHFLNNHLERLDDISKACTVLGCSATKACLPKICVNSRVLAGCVEDWIQDAATQITKLCSEIVFGDADKIGLDVIGPASRNGGMHELVSKLYKIKTKKEETADEIVTQKIKAGHDALFTRMSKEFTKKDLLEQAEQLGLYVESDLKKKDIIDAIIQYAIDKKLVVMSA